MSTWWRRARASVSVVVLVSVGVGAGLSIDLLREEAAAEPGVPVTAAKVEPLDSARFLDCPKGDRVLEIVPDYVVGEDGDDSTGSSSAERAIEDFLALRGVPEPAPAKAFEKADRKSDDDEGTFVSERNDEVTSAVQINESEDSDEVRVAEFAVCQSALEE